VRITRKGKEVLIQGKEVTLRSVKERDLSLMRDWRNKEQIRKWFFDSRLITSQMQQEWYESYLEKDDDQMFIISISSVDIGTIALYHIDRVSKEAQLGRFLIGEDKYRSRGFAYETVLLLLEYAFNELNLENIYLELFSDNEVALNLYRKVGFQEEKVGPKIVGSYPEKKSITRMSLLQSDFESVRRA